MGEVEPALTGNRDKASHVQVARHFLLFEMLFFQLAKLIETLDKQLTEKGQEINGYIEKHNIQIQGRKDRSAPAAASGDGEGKASTSSVLVSDSAK